MSNLAERIRAINETVEACRHGSADGLTIAMIWDTTAKQAGELLMNNAPTILAGLAAMEAMAVVRKKLGLPEDATAGDVYGQLNIWRSNSEGYVTYIKAYRCNDKQGEIARLTVDLSAALEERDKLRGALHELLTTQDTGHFGTCWGGNGPICVRCRANAALQPTPETTKEK